MSVSTPAPTPSRANYGFALYLASYTAFGLYIVWTFLPDDILVFFGLTFLPQKYWAVAVPIHACVTLALVAFVLYPALNLTHVPPSNDMSILIDEYTNYNKVKVQPEGIPPIYDIPLTEVCEKLFLRKDYLIKQELISFTELNLDQRVFLSLLIMRLYYTEASPPCRTIVLLADILNIELELVITSPKKGETTTPSFLQMNPQHVVPTLVDDDGFVIWESRAIAKYLVGKYADNANLYPNDFYKRLDVDKILDFDLGTMFRRSTDYFISVLLTGKFDPSKKPKVDDAMNVLNTILSRNKSGFVAANQLSIADISLLTIITSLEVVEYDMSEYSHVCHWLNKIKNSIPSYETKGVKGELAFKEMVNACLK